MPNAIIKHRQDHGTWTSACETKADIVFSACVNSAASPISSETMNTTAITSRPQHFRLPLFTAAGRREKPPAQVGRIHLFSRVGDVGSLSPERIGDGRERAGRKKGEIDLQSVPRFENR